MGKDGRADRRILVAAAVVVKDKVGHGPVIAKSSLVTQKALVDPAVLILHDQVAPVAGQGPIFGSWKG